MTGHRGFVDTIANIGAIAASGSEVDDKLADILDAALHVVHVEGWMVWGVDPLTGRRSRLFATGYPDALMEYLDGPGWERDVVAPFSHARGGWPARVRDLPFEPRQLHCMSDHYLPLGFVEGCVAPLSSVGGRYTGFLDCIVSDRRQPSDAGRDLVAAMSRILGRLIDPVEERRRAIAFMRAEQVVIEVASVGGQTVEGLRSAVVRAPRTESHDELISRFAAVFELAAGSSEPWWAAQFVWESPEGVWYRCRCMRRYDGNLLLGITPLAGRPHDLSRRELEVLTLVAEGARNEEIAQQLVVTLRTVKAHVEHILEKLELPTRSAATTKAIEEGLLLRPPLASALAQRPATASWPLPSAQQSRPLSLSDRPGIELSSQMRRDIAKRTRRRA